MGRLPYSFDPLSVIAEKDEIYHHPSRQVVPINKQYNLSNSIIMKDLQSIDFSNLDMDTKLKLIFDTIQDTQKNTYNLLTALLAVLVIILIKISLKK